MRQLLKHYSKIMIFGVIISGIIILLPTPEFSLLMINILSAPFNLVILLLNELSLYHPITNVLAWLIFLVIVISPLLIAFKYHNKAYHSQLFVLIMITISLTSAYFIYGILNHIFTKPLLMDSWSQVKPIIVFSMSIILISLILTAVGLVFFKRLSNPQTGILVLQVGLIITAFMTSIMMLLPYQTIFANYSGSMSEVIELMKLLTSSFISGLFIIIIYHAVTLLEMIKQKTFSSELLSYLKSLQHSSQLLLLLSLLMPIFNGLLSYIFFHNIDNVNVNINFPINEILFVSLCLVLSYILMQGIDTTTENEGFI
jgi:hypothetical protein